MAERYPIDQRVLIFKSDLDLTDSLVNAGFSLINGDTYPILDTEYEDLAELLLDNNDYIVDNTVITLVGESFVRGEVKAAIGFGDTSGDSQRPSSMTDAVYQQVFYTYKYSSVKNFFKENYKKFLPDFDVWSIEDSGKKELLVQAFMTEMDRFAQTMDYLYDLPDIDKIPEAYLGYLAQIVGYERADYILLSTNATFRELLKNIVEIYKIKGTNYSFELFLNFLGFNTQLREFWFDKRYSDPGIATNPFSTETKKNRFSFYLTPYKPTDVILPGMQNPYLVTDDDIVRTQDVKQFDKYTSLYEADSTTGYSYQKLIGDSYGYPGTPYTFFKTNVIQYNLTALGTGQEAELTTEETRIINHYIEFLTPIFLDKQVLIAVRPYSEKAYSLFMMDYDRNHALPNNSQYKLYDGFSISDINIGEWGDTEGDTQIPAVVTVADPSSILYNYLSENRVGYVALNTDDTVDGTYRLDFGDTTGIIENSILRDGSNTLITLSKPLKEGGDSDHTGDTLTIGRPEPMHLSYETAFPRTLNYGDTAIWGDSYLISYRHSLGDTYWANVQPNSQLKYFGQWISGFHTDTREAIYDGDTTTSVYYKIQAANPSWGRNQVLTEIASQLEMGDTGLFGLTYKVRGRDLISPMMLSYSHDYTRVVPQSDLSIGSKIPITCNYSLVPGDSGGRFTERLYRDGVSRVRIVDIDVDNGSSQSVVKVLDPYKLYRFFGDSGDYVHIFDLPGDSGGDSNEGTYRVVSSTGADGDSGDTSYITLDSVMPGIDSGDSAGFLQLYYADWTLGSFRYSFLWDKELEVFIIPSYRILVHGSAPTECNHKVYQPSGLIEVSSEVIYYHDGFYREAEGKISFTGGRRNNNVYPGDDPLYSYETN